MEQVPDEILKKNVLINCLSYQTKILQLTVLKLMKEVIEHLSKVGLQSNFFALFGFVLFFLC